jgi:hypothetical protein
LWPDEWLGDTLRADYDAKLRPLLELLVAQDLRGRLERALS